MPCPARSRCTAVGSLDILLSGHLLVTIQRQPSQRTTQKAAAHPTRSPAEAGSDLVRESATAAAISPGGRSFYLTGAGVEVPGAPA